MKKVLSAIISLIIIITGTGLANTAYAVQTPVIKINAVTGKPGGFAVSWKRKSNVISYQIQYSTSSKFPKGGYKIVTINNPDCYGKTITGCMSERVYYVRLRAYMNIEGKKQYTPWSSAKSVKTRNKNEPKPTKIKSLTATASSFTVSWEAEKTAGGYQIQYSKNSKMPSADSTYVYVDSTNATSKTVSGLKTGDKYYVRVRSRNAVNGKRYYSSFTGVESITLKNTNVKSISITTAAGLTIEQGNTLKLNAQIYPANASDKTILWKTSDKTKAVVDANGVVTALRATEYVLITASSKDGGYSDSYELKITAQQGLLKKSDLDKLHLTAVKNLMIVAHPDDEMLWGGAHLLSGEYLVVVLTNSYKPLRKDEFETAMSHTNDKCIILSYPDIKKSWYDSEHNYHYQVDEWSVCKNGIINDINLILNYKKWDTVVTHNPAGEYGHLHHKLTSKYVTYAVNNSPNSCKTLYYFGNYYTAEQNNPEPMLDGDTAKIKNDIVNIYLDSSPNALKRHRHMVPYENWIESERWNELKK